MKRKNFHFLIIQPHTGNQIKGISINLNDKRLPIPETEFLLFPPILPPCDSLTELISLQIFPDGYKTMGITCGMSMPVCRG